MCYTLRMKIIKFTCSEARILASACPYVSWQWIASFDEGISCRTASNIWFIEPCKRIVVLIRLGIALRNVTSWLWRVLISCKQSKCLETPFKLTLKNNYMALVASTQEIFISERAARDFKKDRLQHLNEY